MHNYLLTTNTRVLEQFGFRKRISTENAAFKLTDSTLKAINKKNPCSWNILSFGKSFQLCKSQNFVN
jgi:hypothetical protein